MVVVDVVTQVILNDFQLHFCCIIVSLLLDLAVDID